MVVRDYLKDQEFRPNPFKEGVPGRDWWSRFLKRWSSELSVRKPQHLPTHRAVSATVEVLDSWFLRVRAVLEKAGLDTLPLYELQKYLWNCDETGFSTSVASKKSLPNVERKMSRRLSVVVDVTTSQYSVQDQLMVPAYHHL